MGIISMDDYEKIDHVLLEKYKLSLSSLYRDMDLIYKENRGNEFKNQVDFIVAAGPNTLDLHLRDGTIRTVEWKDRSRSESWTPEMKERAREHALRRHHG